MTKFKLADMIRITPALLLSRVPRDIVLPAWERSAQTKPPRETLQAVGDRTVPTAFFLALLPRSWPCGTPEEPKRA